MQMSLGKVSDPATAKRIEAISKKEGTSWMGAVVFLATGKKPTRNGRHKGAKTESKRTTKRQPANKAKAATA